MSLIRRIATIATPQWQRGLPAMQARMMSDKVHDKESQMEKDFVSRQEREALKRMLAKLDQQADPGNQKALSALEAKMQASGTKLTEQMKKDLLEWKSTAH